MSGNQERRRLPTDQSRVDKLPADRSGPEALKPHRPELARRRRTRAMSGRPNSVAIVAEFLRRGLADDPVLVSDLEASAQAAGLLGKDQCITHAKLFKEAKKSLGIKSVRNGFGSAGEWLWLLEKPPAPPVTTPAPPVTAPSSVVVSRVPSSWIEGVAGLKDHRHPADIPAHRWHQLLGDCNNFLTSSENWAERAAELGWDAVALFGCRRHRPLEHLGGAGLLWAINGGRILELHRGWAVLELPPNGARRIIDGRRVDVANATLPWRFNLGPPKVSQAI
jgi:hypothetical protein